MAEEERPTLSHGEVEKVLDSTIPSNWLDPLFEKLGKHPWGCPDIERFLTALKKELNTAICQLAPEKQVSEPKEPIMSQWISVEDRLPNAYETGDWDGKKSDSVVVELANGKYEVAHLYSGFMDGSEFNDWYANDGFTLDGEVVQWMPLPPAPEQEEG